MKSSYLRPDEVSLRDHFAGMAMMGILNVLKSAVSYSTDSQEVVLRVSDISKKSFDLADAMLAEALRREG